MYPSLIKFSNKLRVFLIQGNAKVYLEFYTPSTFANFLDTTVTYFNSAYNLSKKDVHFYI